LNNTPDDFDFEKIYDIGVLTKFDQDEILKEAIDKHYFYGKKTEADKEEMLKRETHNISKWGGVFYPNSCVDP